MKIQKGWDYDYGVWTGPYEDLEIDSDDDLRIDTSTGEVTYIPMNVLLHVVAVWLANKADRCK